MKSFGTHARRLAASFVTFGLLAAGAAVPAVATAPSHSPARGTAVRFETIRYRAHDGAVRDAVVVLPDWYGPRRNPPLPLVISPHGRGATAKANAAFFGTLPATGGFLVVCPAGMGQRLDLLSYGYRGQIDDLARMPAIVRASLPWVRIDGRRVYAVGSSMGGQETALLVARHPGLLAGAAVMDAVTDLTRRWRQMPDVPGPAWYGRKLRTNLEREVGGTPTTRAREYDGRSPLAQSRAIAFSGVPLQLWWSARDRIVFDQRHQTAALFRELRRLNPCAPVSAYAGVWRHSSEMRSTALLPVVLARFGLLDHGKPLPATVRYVPEPTSCAV